MMITFVYLYQNILASRMHLDIPETSVEMLNKSDPDMKGSSLPAMRTYARTSTDVSIN